MYVMDVPIDACMNIYILTYAVELLLQVGHVVAFGDPEIVISVIGLVDTVVWSSSANG